MGARDLAALKERAERLRKDAAKAEGALERVAEQLREEFKCDSVEAAEKLLSRLRREEREADRSYRSACRRFERRWGDRLG